MATDIGDFCWTELLAVDINKSTEFYKSLFGWGTETMPLGNNETYVMYKVGDTRVAGGMQINDEMRAKQVLPHWNSYVLVDDIHESVKAAQALGATIYKDVADVTDMGKMAVIADPTGAAFSLWQAMKTNDGQSLPKNAVGNIGWYELMTMDTDKAGKFYTDLFKWTVNSKKMPTGEVYNMFMIGDKPVAGMMKPEKENNFKPFWGVYFTVSNLDECINKAKKLGATLWYEPMTIADVGRITMIKAPDGESFSVIEFS